MIAGCVSGPCREYDGTRLLTVGCASLCYGLYCGYGSRSEFVRRSMGHAPAHLYAAILYFYSRFGGLRAIIDNCTLVHQGRVDRACSRRLGLGAKGLSNRKQ